VFLNHKNIKLAVKVAFIGPVFLWIACGRSENSQEKVVDIASTPAKWQSIGNCWIYSTLGWMESLAVKNRQVALDFSETYITYRHWQEHLAYSSVLKTGGNVQEALSLLKKYGVMLEKDVVPKEAGLSKSETQKAAQAYIEKSLASGALKVKKDQQTILKELDIAFGINMKEVEKKAISLESLMIGKGSDGKIRSMADEALSWTTLGWSEEQFPSEIPGVNPARSDRQQRILKIVKAALNAGNPVVMDWFVDFGALDNKGVFSLETLKQKPNEKQGFHSTVLEDYVVSVKDPATNIPRTIGEGEVSDSDKALALNYGEISYFVVKNSWGGLERRDRASYVRNREGGFHRLDSNYLFSSIRNREQDFVTSVVTGFFIPREFLKIQ